MVFSWQKQTPWQSICTQFSTQFRPNIPVKLEFRFDILDGIFSIDLVHLGRLVEIWVSNVNKSSNDCHDFHGQVSKVAVKIHWQKYACSWWKTFPPFLKTNFQNSPIYDECQTERAKVLAMPWKLALWDESNATPKPIRGFQLSYSSECVKVYSCRLSKIQTVRNLQVGCRV